MKTTRFMMVLVLMLGITAVALCQGDSSGILSRQVVSAIKQYNAALEKAEKDYNIAINKATDDLLVSLKKAKSDTTKTGNLDEALKIDAKIRELEATKQEIAEKMRPEKVEKKDKTDKMKRFEESFYGTTWQWTDESGIYAIRFAEPTATIITPWGETKLIGSGLTWSFTLGSPPMRFKHTITFDIGGKRFAGLREDGIPFTGVRVEK